MATIEYDLNNSIDEKGFDLIGFRLHVDSDGPDFYTLITFGEYKKRPLMLNNKIVFFDKIELALFALEEADAEMRSIGQPPDEITLICDVPEVLYLVENKNIDETALILNCLNTFFDLIEAENVVMRDDYKSKLYKFADHLTFNREFAFFLQEQNIMRATLKEAILWCVDTIFSGSIFLSCKDCIPKLPCKKICSTNGGQNPL